MAEPPGPGVRVTFGTIIDDTVACIPALVQRNPAGQPIRCERVVSYRTFSVTAGHPSLDDDAVQYDVPPESRHKLIEAAILAAARRALCAVCPYLRLFMQENPGGEPLEMPEDGQASAYSKMKIGVGASSTRETAHHAAALYQHVLASTRDTQGARPPPPPMEARPTPATREYCCRCMFCQRRVLFSPCCGTVYCTRCSRSTLHHAASCSDEEEPRMPVPVVSRYAPGTHQVPRAFHLRTHPTWRIWHYTSGTNYALVSWYDVEDCVYYRDHSGIDFCSALYKKDGPDSWAWVLVFDYRVKPNGAVNIAWRVYMSRRYSLPEPSQSLDLPEPGL